jgi:protein TonB
MSPAKILFSPRIEYTQKAIDNLVEGLMIVRCVITISGEVRDCQTVQSVRFMDTVVLDALKGRRYAPITLQGQPVEVIYTFKIRLNLPQ